MRWVNKMVREITASVVDQCFLTWTGGEQQLLTDIPANQLLVVEEVPRTQDAGRGKWWLGIGLLLVVLAGIFARLRKGSRSPA